MSLLPKTHHDFSQKEYWDSFFTKRNLKAFEWYGEYPELSTYLHKYIKQRDEIVIVGCGNSTLGRDLFDLGYNKITNIDISHVVIKQMRAQNAQERPDLKFEQMDALAMSFDDESCTVVLDKGTLDALMPDEKPETIENITKYFTEIQRVLKPAGRFVCVSLLQEHILKALLNYFPSNNWMFRVVRCFEAERKTQEQGENAMPVFVVVCTKFKNLPQKVLELNLVPGDKMQRCDENEIRQQIRSLQEVALVCSGVRRSKIEEEVSLDLFNASDNKRRFSVHVVDGKSEARNMQYAAFVVPQGREAEWLFSTPSGRLHLASSIKTNRLAIISLHREQSYGSLNEVQEELIDCICFLAPLGLKDKKIPFLSLGSDIGVRTVVYEGSSEQSGEYIVEDVVIDDAKFRRLYYLQSQNVIQSEAKLKLVKGKKHSREVVDFAHLCCSHHVYMSVATQMACSELKTGKVLVVGLGGGGLCIFLRKFLPKITIKALEIDPDMLVIAKKCFGLVEDDKLNVEVKDGLKYLHDISENEGFDAVLFDVDCKDNTIGISCPPQEFLESALLDKVARIIKENGVFILNLVIRDASLKPAIINNICRKFKTVVSYSLTQDLNEILICTTRNLKEQELRDKLQKAVGAVNTFFKKNHVNDSNQVDIEEFLQNICVK